MNLLRFLAPLAALLLAAGCASAPAGPDGVAQVRAAETAFAQSMADRDFNAFASHVADDAVFINGGQPLRGKEAILAFWKRFFERPQAPFSWKPELAETTLAGDLGYTQGPVAAPDGKVFATFYSTWRREASGRWLIVFDNGYPACDCKR
jgi:uncharacterized protein (TIGR02246 family)